MSGRATFWEGTKRGDATVFGTEGIKVQYLNENQNDVENGIWATRKVAG